jgi:4-cresol dehydrogenase (hydroxylating)
VDDLVGLEVVLPDGDLLHAGWWPEADRVTPVYEHGLGPALMPLFLQSNLGVVTAIVVRLLPRPEAQRVLKFSFAHDVFIEAVDELRRWTAQGLVRGVLKVYDTTSAVFYGSTAGQFLAYICVDGTQASVDALTAVITEEAATSGLFDPVLDNKDDVVANMVRGAHSGNPGYNDAVLEATLGKPADDVDASGLGWLSFLPLVPFTGKTLSRAHELLAQIHNETGMRCGATLNALSADVVDFVVSMKFHRLPGEVERAHRALDRAYELFTAAGFIPYRVDVDHAGWVDRLSPDLSARTFVRRLKNVIDPHCAIELGRYA